MPKKVEFPASQGQIRLLKLLEIEYPEGLSYTEAKELLTSKELPPSGVPDQIHPSKARHMSDQQLLEQIWLERHMREEHQQVWCAVCKTYHPIQDHA